VWTETTRRIFSILNAIEAAAGSLGAASINRRPPQSYSCHHLCQGIILFVKLIFSGQVRAFSLKCGWLSSYTELYGSAFQ
jgi:hypothetical protein